MAQVTLKNVTVFFDEITIQPNYSEEPATASYYTTRVRISNQNAFDITIKQLWVQRKVDIYEYGFFKIWQPDEVHFPVNVTIPANTVELALELTGPGPEGNWTEGNTTNLQGRVYFVEFQDQFDAFIDAFFWSYPVNTGYKAWSLLEEYFVDSGELSGNTKPNDPADPDYVVPIYDTVTCPLP